MRDVEIYVPEGWQQTVGTVILAVGLLIVLVILGAIGKNYTADGAIMQHSDWEVLQVERAARSELTQMQTIADDLAELLSEDPDPIRAQIVADNAEAKLSSGLSVLENQRSALIAAAETVRSWSMGVVDRDQAVDALNQAIAGLQEFEQGLSR